ncbi:MAG TPA: formate dehydrogenase accessory protein FdhE [Syntrophomonadaceae bacterium]|nr:formate dehydrogenase accessory protein FdhE [Syntrophomonadaceae bacterium]
MSRQVPVTLPEGYVDFYKNLETWQNEQQIRLQKVHIPAQANVRQLLSKYTKPLIQLLPSEMDSNAYKEMHSKLLAFIKGSRPESGKMMDTIFNRVSELDFDDLAHKVIAQDYDFLNDLAMKLELPRELFVFTLDHACRPFLRVFAASLADELAREENHWPFPNICPCCGGKSHISRLRASDGRRYMFCDRCFSEWETALLYCVHCGNNEPGTIKYINIDKDPAYLIYVCDKCKGYLKTIDERKLGQSTDLFIANIETIYLDLLARENGYSNHDA